MRVAREYPGDVPEISLREALKIIANRKKPKPTEPPDRADRKQPPATDPATDPADWPADPADSADPAVNPDTEDEQPDDAKPSPDVSTLELYDLTESRREARDTIRQMQTMYGDTLLFCVEGLNDVKAMEMANAVVASLIALDQYLKPKSGTKEWGDFNVNILTGCSHNCRYCYAHQTARQYKRCKGDWAVPKLHKNWDCFDKYFGNVFFQSTSDILPEFLDQSVQVVEQLLEAGNEVLIVTKPHLECVKRLCTLPPDHLMFRFTVGLTPTTRSLLGTRGAALRRTAGKPKVCLRCRVQNQHLCRAAFNAGCRWFVSSACPIRDRQDLARHAESGTKLHCGLARDRRQNQGD